MLVLNQLIYSLPGHVLILILLFHLRTSLFLSTVFPQNFNSKPVYKFMPSYSPCTLNVTILETMHSNHETLIRLKEA
jgi:hypothetical protein